VTTETTERTSTDDSEPTIAEQAPSLQALAGLAHMFSQLPSAYLMVHAPYRTGLPSLIKMQLNSPQDFEQWRAALQIAPADVDIHTKDKDTWMSADTVAHGAPIHLTGFGVGLAAEQASEPRDRDEVAA
jgi:hypothetical protein